MKLGNNEKLDAARDAYVQKLVDLAKDHGMTASMAEGIRLAARSAWEDGCHEGQKSIVEHLQTVAGLSQ